VTRWLVAPVRWAYDFLADDPVLLLGTAIAVGVVAIVVHASKSAAGIILYAALVVVIAASLWRAATSGKG
jgi:hypothetical protein